MNGTPQTLESPPASPLTWRGGWMGLAALLCLVVFFWLPESYLRMVGWPWVVIWQLGFLVLSILCIWMLRQFQIPFRTLGYGMDWAVGLIVLSLVLSTLLAPFREVAAWNLVLCLAYGLLLYTARNWLGSRGFTLDRLWLGLVVVSVITSGVSLAMWQPDPAMWLSNEFSAAIRNRWPLGQHNFVGGYYVLVVPLVLSFALSRKGWQRLVGFLASLLTLLTLYISGSRGALLGGLVILAAFIITALRQSRGKQRWIAMGLSIASLLVAVAALFSNPRVRNLIPWDRLLGQASSTQPFVLEGPTMDRLLMLKSAAAILRDRPLFGVGIGNMSRVNNLYRSLEAGTGLEHIQQLHNTPVQLAGEMGLLGLAAYVVLLVMLARLWLKLHRQLTTPTDRWLLVGVGTSLLAYGVSSLTDYQLENIAISVTLVLYVVLLIGLADRGALEPAPVSITRRYRRLLSLGGLALIVLMVRGWLPADTAMYFSYVGNQKAAVEDFKEADYRWDTASQLAPWDPIYSAIAAQQILQVREFAKEKVDQQVLTDQAIDYYQRSVAASPNDAWFNQNLAFVLLPIAPEQAAFYAGRTAQLLPRNFNYTYYLMALAYLEQGKVDQAIAALVLESLVNSQFLTLDLWFTPPLADLKPQVLEKALALYTQLLESTGPQIDGYATLYEQLVLLEWWHARPLTQEVQSPFVRPVVQALVLTDTDPQAALQILNQAIDAGALERGLFLLRAWIAPEIYLEDYIKQFSIGEDEAANIRTHIAEYRDSRDWLNSIMVAKSPRYRYGVTFAYRNLDANRANRIFRPENIRTSAIADLLEVFWEFPRVFLPLDELIDQYRTDALGLPNPSQTGYRLVPEHPPEP